MWPWNIHIFCSFTFHIIISAQCAAHSNSTYILQIYYHWQSLHILPRGRTCIMPGGRQKVPVWIPHKITVFHFRIRLLNIQRRESRIRRRHEREVGLIKGRAKRAMETEEQREARLLRMR